MKKNNEKKVLVMMSGGVDSSVASVLLKKQGFDVTGGFMKNFSRESWHGVLDDDCPWEEDFQDVKNVCALYDIPCRSFNFEKEYRAKVIEYFFSEYAKGNTPNPDIMCNKEIKFSLFMDKAKKLGFDYIATGHYARKREIKNQKSKIKNYELLKGVDSAKDQSYFLYTLTQKQLSKILFPIGEYTKAEVRAMAKRWRLPNAEKPDSQGVCFVGHINLREFLKQRLPEKRGVILDTEGNTIGEHPGSWYYTIGQRRGIGIVDSKKPHYVVAKDVKRNVLVVAEGKRDNHLYGTSILLKKIHWISSMPPKLPLRCKIKIRYRQVDTPCVVRKKQTKGFVIAFRHPQFAPAQGQSAVLYAGQKVLGGGIIHQVHI